MVIVKEYTISEIAEIMGVMSSTIRFYEREGLLPDIKRKNGKRIFTDDDFRWIKVLNCLKNTGMALKDIKIYFELSKKGDSTLQDRYDIIANQKEIIYDKIEELKLNLKELEYKEWYYKKAIEAGTEDIHKNRPCNPTLEPDEIPKE